MKYRILQVYTKNILSGELEKSFIIQQYKKYFLGHKWVDLEVILHEEEFLKKGECFKTIKEAEEFLKDFLELRKY